MERLPVDPVERRAGEGRGRANALRIESAKAAGLANTQTEIDVATFTQWVNAYAQKQTRLTDFYFKRFRKEFRPAVKAWVATRPLKNPNAPLTPFAMPQYKLAARAEAERLDAEAEVYAAEVRADIQRASNYVLGVVLFASALFFAGMSTKLTVTEAARRDARDRLRRLSLHRALDRDLAGQRDRLNRGGEARLGLSALFVPAWVSRTRRPATGSLLRPRYRSPLGQALLVLRRMLVLEARQPLEPARQVPVPLAEQLHRRRQQHRRGRSSRRSGSPPRGRSPSA